MRKKSSAKSRTPEESGEIKKDNSPYCVKDHPKLNVPLNIRENIPFTDKQKELFRIIQDKKTKVVFISGSAGTSKTLSAVYCGLHELNSKKFNQLIYIRAAIESADGKLGFLPGSEKDKVGPYLIPLMEKLDEFLAESQVSALINNGFVEGSPVGFLRGRNFANKYVIVDEAQNLSRAEILLIISRLGEFSKLIICADPSQSDLPQNKRGAFEFYRDIFSDEESKEEGIHSFNFTNEDIVRSGLVKFIVQKIEKEAEKKAAEKSQGDWLPGMGK